MARVMEIKTPLGQDDLLFQGMSATEELGRLFEYQISVLGARNDIDPGKLLGKNVTVKLELPDGKWRHFDGYVTRFGQVGAQGRYFLYRIVARPWLWLLTRTTDCRIFQGKTVPEILKEIFDKYPNAVVEDRLTSTYRTWEYCVQYRESDFNFVSRLMEQEGIYYYFTHADNKHTLVLADSSSAHSPFPGYEEIPFIAQERAMRLEQECVSDWQFSRQIEPGKYVLDGFDFKKPSTDLQVRTTLKRDYAEADHEHFDYPGEYLSTAEGDHYVRVRLEERQAEQELAQGTANARGLSVGSLFKLVKQARPDQNREYLVVAAHYRLDYNEYESQPGSGANYACSFTALHSREAFRPRRATPKPAVQGPQTAIVVGPSGDEIYTDNYGRVKLQFHWDRLGKSDENSSCWVRVSHPWAGKSWGMVAIPRIGQEVLVDFLEGDPDQPLITGRVYNAEQMPPYELPANKTQTGIKSRSSSGGSPANFNEIRFEDKKGAEQVYIHAEKNQDNVVENDETTTVGHDRTETVGNNETITIGVDRTEKVGANEKITIGSNRTESVGVNEDITIGVNRTENVGANESITIGANRTISVGASESATVALQRTHTVGVNETIAIGAAQEVAIGAFQAVVVGAYQTVNVGANQAVSVGVNRSVDVGSKLSTNVGADEARSVTNGRSTSVGKDDALKVGKNLVIDAGDSVTIKTGDASITMNKDGTIVIKGKDIKVEGSGKINVKASSDVVIKGSKVGIN